MFALQICGRKENSMIKKKSVWKQVFRSCITVLLSMALLSGVTFAADITLQSDELPFDGWTFSVSSRNTMPDFAFDGDPNTYFHSAIDPQEYEPHEFRIHMNKSTEIGGVRYTPRQDLEVGRMIRGEFYASDDGEKWYLVGEYEHEPTAETVTVIFPHSVKANHFKIKTLETGYRYFTIAELRLLKPTTEIVPLNQAQRQIQDNKLMPIKGPDVKASASSVQGGSPASNAIDDSTSTFWHSQYSPQEDPPFEFTMDLGRIYSVCGVRYLPRSSDVNGYFLKTEIYTSLDGESYQLIQKVDWADNAEMKYAMFGRDVKARYVQLKILETTFNHGIACDISALMLGSSWREDRRNEYERYTVHIGNTAIDTQRSEKFEKIQSNTAAIEKYGVPMITAEALEGLLGCSVTFNEENYRVEFSRNDLKLSFQVNDDRVYRGNQRYNLAQAPVIRDGQVMLPLDFIAEQIGYDLSEEQDGAWILCNDPTFEWE